MTPRTRSSFNPLTVVGALIVASVVFGLVVDRAPSDAPPPECEGAKDPLCVKGAPGESAETSAGGAGQLAELGVAAVLRASAVCVDVGYLCAALATSESIFVRRWRDFSGTLVVHIPRPEFEDPGEALALQQAASLGIRAWNGQPFPILIDLQGDRNPHFSIRWLRELGGNQIGVTRVQWSSATGLSVVSIDLATRSLRGLQELADPRQVRLTAAHEMGHALGLPHSDAPTDVMYPTNTATALSPRDYRTMESLYGFPDGTEIVR